MPKPNWKYRPDKEHRYFLYDPEGDGTLFFRTPEERDDHAKKTIREYCDPHEGWHEDVRTVCGGYVSHIATETDHEDRPEDPEQAEEDGWPQDCDYRCNYKFALIV